TVYVFNDNGKIDSIIYGEYSNNPKDYDIMTYNSEGKVTDYDVYYDNITQLEDSRTFSYNISGQVEKITYKDTNPRIDSLYWENDKLITEKSYGYSGSEYELSNIDIKKYNGDNIIEELKYTVTDLGFGIDTLLYDSITYSNFLDIPNLLEEGIEGVYGFGFPLWRNLNFYQNESYTEIDINSGTEDLSTAVFSINSENDFPITVTETYDDGNVYTHKFTYTLK
ncbi:MAG: hypothetical protein AB8B61_00930, partial [Cyclobacteriaceae bacterium]